MTQTFIPGDYLAFQLESGFGLVRVLAISGDNTDRVWHLCVYRELFPDIESAEEALAHSELLHLSEPHLALTDRAFERTPAARLSHRPVEAAELDGVKQWKQGAEQTPLDRSLLLLLGMR